MPFAYTGGPPADRPHCKVLGCRSKAYASTGMCEDHRQRVRLRGTIASLPTPNVRRWRPVAEKILDSRATKATLALHYRLLLSLRMWASAPHTGFQRMPKARKVRRGRQAPGRVMYEAVLRRYADGDLTLRRLTVELLATTLAALSDPRWPKPERNLQALLYAFGLRIEGLVGKCDTLTGRTICAEGLPPAAIAALVWIARDYLAKHHHTTETHHAETQTSGPRAGSAGPHQPHPR